MTEPRRRNISQRSEMIFDNHEYNILTDTREVFLCSHYNRTHEDDEVDHLVASNFIKNIRILNHLGKEKILVHCLSPGGDYNYGMACYDIVKDSCESEAGSEIVMLAHGYCCSMGSIIIQAASKRVLAPNSDFLIHDGSIELGGNWRSVVSRADWSKKIRENTIEIYADRCAEGNYWKKRKMNKEDVKAWLRDNIDKTQELYLSPREAVDMGFADAVLGDDGYETIEMLRS